MLSRRSSLWLLLVAVILIASFDAVRAVTNGKKIKVLHEWTTLEYDWNEMGEDRNTWINDGRFIPTSCALAGVKQWGDRTFVTVPRWRSGVPATLNEVVKVDGVSLLRPYPSLDLQDPTREKTIKYVQSMEIDTMGRMWIIDAGILYQLEDNNYKYIQPRIIVIDLETNVIIKTYDFPEGVVIKNKSFLNDIVVDEHSQFAYISDAGGDGGIIVFDYANSQSRRFADDSTKIESGADTLNVCGITLTILPTPSDGIALSTDRQTLYYCPLSGVRLHSIPTALLRDFSVTQLQLSGAVLWRGNKVSLSDGLTIDNRGRMFFGNLGNCSVHYWDTRTQYLSSDNQLQLSQDNELLEWADTFGFDGDNGLLVTSNRLAKFLNNRMDFNGGSGPNFRVLRIDIGADSYLESASTANVLCVCNIVSLFAVIVALIVMFA